MWFDKVVYYLGSKMVIYLGEKYIWKLMMKTRTERKNLYLMEEIDTVYSKLIKEYEDDEYVYIKNL